VKHNVIQCAARMMSDDGGDDEYFVVDAFALNVFRLYFCPVSAAVTPTRRVCVWFMN